MRAIELKSIPTDDGGTFLYKDVLINTLKRSPSGMQIEEMEKVLRIIGTIRRAESSVLLEEADWEYVVKRLNATAWGTADGAIVQFVKDVKDSKNVEVEQVVKSSVTQEGAAK